MLQRILQSTRSFLNKLVERSAGLLEQRVAAMKHKFLPSRAPRVSAIRVCTGPYRRSCKLINAYNPPFPDYGILFNEILGRGTYKRLEKKYHY